jgi:hypothetical protein
VYRKARDASAFGRDARSWAARWRPRAPDELTLYRRNAYTFRPFQRIRDGTGD